MKKPTIILEWDCDGIACHEVVRVEIRHLQPADLTEDALRALMATNRGAQTLGRNTVFCAKCAGGGESQPMISAPYVSGQCDGKDGAQAPERCRRSVVFAVPLVVQPELLPALLARTHAGWGYRGEKIFCPDCIAVMRAASLRRATAATAQPLTLDPCRK